MNASQSRKAPYTKGRNSIVFAIGSLARGGAESQLVLLATTLALRGSRVAVFALEANGQLAHTLREHKIELVDGGYRGLATSRLQYIGALLRAAWRLCWFLARTRPQVVHGFLPLTNFYAAVCGRATLRPLIVTSKRALGNHQDRSPITKVLDRVANTLSSTITANSEAVAQDCSRRDGVPLGEIVVIPNGLEFSKFKDKPAMRERLRREYMLSPGDIGIVKVANLIPYKGHAELITAFGDLARNDPRLRLILVGEDRGIESALAEQAVALGVADRITFAGQRSDVADILSAMDIGVMASHEEGFSNALLEKLATGLPIVATNVGGNPAALADMPGCRLVAPQDPDSLRQGLSEIIEGLAHDEFDRVKRREMLRARYSVETMVAAYEAIYFRAEE